MVEADLIAYLASQGFEAYAELPADVGLGSLRPLVTVERTGGYSIHRSTVEAATVAVQSWAASTLEAAELARLVDRALAAAADHVPAVMRCERTAMYRFTDGQRPRYQATYDLIYMED